MIGRVDYDIGDINVYTSPADAKCKIFMTMLDDHLPILIADTVEVVTDRYVPLAQFKERFDDWCSRFDHIQFQRVSVVTTECFDDDWNDYRTVVSDYYRKTAVVQQYELPWSRYIDDESVLELFE